MSTPLRIYWCSPEAEQSDAWDSRHSTATFLPTRRDAIRWAKEHGSFAYMTSVFSSKPEGGTRADETAAALAVFTGTTIAWRVPGWFRTERIGEPAIA